MDKQNMHWLIVACIREEGEFKNREEIVNVEEDKAEEKVLKAHEYV